MDDQRKAWNDLYRTQGRQWRGIADVDVPFAPGDKVLDVGCGNGKTSAALMEMGCIVTGMDFSEEAVEHCARSFPDMRSVCASATSLPFEDNEFDGVVMVHVLEHLTSDEIAAAAAEAFRVLKNNGILFIRSFSANDMRSGSMNENSISLRGNGIRYTYRSEDELADAFRMFDVVSLGTVEKRTKFGTTRSRIEGLFTKKP